MKPRTAALLGLAALLAGAGAWMWHGRDLDRRMVMADPDVLPADLFAHAVPLGRETFAAHCASCHGADGKGDSARGVPSLVDIDRLYGAGTVGDIEQIIAHGIRAANGKSRAFAIMPAYATARPSPTEAIPPLTPGDISDVIDYLLKTGNPESARRGATIFGDRGGCFDCHGADAKGDPAVGVPDLTDAIWLSGDGSRDALYNTIARGSAGMCPAWLGTLDARALRATAVYVHSLSHPATPPLPSR